MKFKNNKKPVGIFDGVNPKVSPINNVIIKFSDKIILFNKKKNPQTTPPISCYYISKDKIYQQLHFYYKLKQWLLLLSSIFYKFKDLI